MEQSSQLKSASTTGDTKGVLLKSLAGQDGTCAWLTSMAQTQPSCCSSPAVITTTKSTIDISRDRWGGGATNKMPFFWRAASPLGACCSIGLLLHEKGRNSFDYNRHAGFSYTQDISPKHSLSYHPGVLYEADSLSSKRGMGMNPWPWVHEPYHILITENLQTWYQISTASGRSHWGMIRDNILKRQIAFLWGAEYAPNQ